MRIAIIGGAIELLHRARDLGVEVVLFHKPGAFDPRSTDVCEKIVPVDFTADPLATHEAVAREPTDRPFDRVMSFSGTR